MTVTFLRFFVVLLSWMILPFAVCAALAPEEKGYGLWIASS
jgi:hypothetical protein